MPFATARTFRYIRTWLSERAQVVSEEVELDRDGTLVPATLVRPDTKGPWPSWVVLHGITRPGRAHRQLVRFTRSVASTGCAVLIPEVPEWRELSLSPALTAPTVRASMDWLLSSPSTEGDRVGLIGFSFGAPQALTAATDPEIEAHLHGVVGFGGYCDLERTIRFQFTGTHEWEGVTHHARPDPYGRWIVGANYLTLVPGYEDMGDVAEALHSLAAAAGDQGLMSWDPTFDVNKKALGEGMETSHRHVFELFAPGSDHEPEPTAADEMARALAQAAIRQEPEIQPAMHLGRVRCPVHLLHGRHDHLIPFSEGLRLEQALPDTTPSAATVTPLFGHSAQDPFPGAVEGMREGVVFLRALRGILGLV